MTDKDEKYKKGIPRAGNAGYVLGPLVIIAGAIILVAGILSGLDYLLSSFGVSVVILGIVMLMYWRVSRTNVCIELLAKYLSDRERDQAKDTKN